MPAPPMPWPMDGAEAKALRRIPGVASVERLHPPRGHGALHGVVLPVVERAPVLDDLVLSIWVARFSR
jgi:hypothetical protein